jgi:hypothetical protein
MAAIMKASGLICTVYKHFLSFIQQQQQKKTNKYHLYFVLTSSEGQSEIKKLQKKELKNE